MTATARREEILRLVRDNAVHSQDELLALLRRRGIRVTQPTLSRDVRDLGLAKTADGYVTPGELAAPTKSFTPSTLREDRLTSTVREFVSSVAVSGTILVVRTPPASAQPVARAIDEAGLEGVVGTLGGDDTIFVATASTRDAKALERRFGSLLSTSRSPRRTRA